MRSIKSGCPGVYSTHASIGLPMSSRPVFRQDFGQPHKLGGTLAPTIRALSILSAAPYIAMIESLNSEGIVSSLFSKGQQATNSSDPDKLMRCIECIELIDLYVQVSANDQFLEIMRTNLGKLNGGTNKTVK